MTTWDLPPPYTTRSIDTNSLGDIFFIESNFVWTKLAKITISNDTLTEWFIPRQTNWFIGFNSYGQQNMVIDKSETVFFSTPERFFRFVPESEIFTAFDGPQNYCGTFLGMDSTGNLFCFKDGVYEKIE